MAGETTLTVIGRLTADVELRYTQGGLAVANFTIATNARNFDKATNSWKEGETTFFRASIWREHAEHVAGSLTKGTHVIAQGRLKTRNYETSSGEKRSSLELEIDEIGPALRWATASVLKAERGAGAPVAAAVNDEPWAPSAPVAAGAGADVWNTPGNFSDETPF